MPSVTSVARSCKQPYGGYLKPSSFEKTVFEDGIVLNTEENIPGSIVGMAVDYLSRMMNNRDKNDAFRISIRGAACAELGGLKGAKKAASELLDSIKGLDDESIICACKLVTFDVWFRNPTDALRVESNYLNVFPDANTINSIRTLVSRILSFFSVYGPITKDGFTVGNGYTQTVDSGDGDYLTEDTLWDVKVLSTRIKTQHTLQILMYWIMGQHSGMDIFNNISKVGIYNPRNNTVYIRKIDEIERETIESVEREVIRY